MKDKEILLKELKKQNKELEEKILDLEKEIFLEKINKKVRIGSIIKIYMRIGSGFKFKVENIEINRNVVIISGNKFKFCFYKNVYCDKTIQDSWGRNINVLKY